jgi:hypothetical protein
MIPTTAAGGLDFENACMPLTGSGCNGGETGFMSESKLEVEIRAPI